MSIIELTDKVRREIDALTHESMVSLWRFAPAGHPYFVRGPVFDYFKARLDGFGGITPQTSKAVGWDAP
jgi:hypothetical protein